jgi:hypothetical protein
MFQTQGYKVRLQKGKKNEQVGTLKTALTSVYLFVVYETTLSIAYIT